MSTRLNILLALALFVALGQSEAQQNAPPGSGNERCSGTLNGTVVQALGERKLTNMPVYVFTLAQSRRLREMDDCAYKRAHTPGLAPGVDARIEDQNTDAPVDLIPKLPRSAFGKSDSRGAFSISNVPCGQRYCLVSFGIHESGVYLAVKLTPVMKNGESIKVDLRDDVPWSERFKAD
jgi:hypothetical protein